MTPTRRNLLTGRNAVIGVVLLAGFVLGLALVLLGGEDDAPSPTTEPPTTDSAPTERDPTAGVPLELDDEVSEATLAELSELAVPEGATDFLTARLDDDTQLDATFALPPEAVEEFLARSGLPATTPGERLILHSSPLWRLNPEPGQQLRSTSDETDRVRRAVELVDESPDTVRVRITITPL